MQNRNLTLMTKDGHYRPPKKVVGSNCLYLKGKLLPFVYHKVHVFSFLERFLLFSSSSGPELPLDRKKAEGVRTKRGHPPFFTSLLCATTLVTHASLLDIGHRHVGTWENADPRTGLVGLCPAPACSSSSCQELFHLVLTPSASRDQAKLHSQLTWA